MCNIEISEALAEEEDENKKLVGTYKGIKITLFLI